MSETDLIKVQLLIAEAKVSSRDREIADLNKAFDLAIEIASFWRDHTPDEVQLPPELKAKIEVPAL